MADYVCIVGTSDGSVVERTFRGESPSLLRERLELDGYDVFEVRRQGGGWQLPTLRRRRLPPGDFLIVNREFASLVRAGMPVNHALRLLEERRRGTPVGDVLGRVRERIEGGVSLSEAFAAEGDAVAPLYVTTVGVGEASGDLEGALRRYTAYLERAMELRKKVRGAMVYPAILLSLSLGVVGLLLTYVMPRFAEFYASYDAALPLLTRGLLRLSSGLVAAWPLWLALATALVVAALTWLPSDSGRATMARLALRTPGIGPLLHRYLGVQLTRTMSVLLRGGTPMLTALAATQRALENPVFRQGLDRAQDVVRAGGPLYQALGEPGLLDPLGIEMIQVGESTGDLDRMLDEVASHYDEALDSQLQRAVTMLEPALLTVVGLVVAAIVLAVYMPLFRVVEAVG